MFATPWSKWAAWTEFLEFMLTLGMGLYYTVYIITPFWYGQTDMCHPDTLSHMTSICCQLLSEACLPPWLKGGTCWVPAVGLLYMAGITPTSCVPLPLGLFMWLQEEKSLPVKRRVLWVALSCSTSMNGLAQPRVGTVVICVGASVVMESRLDLETMLFSHCVHFSR